MSLDKKLIQNAARIKLACPLSSFSHEMALWCAGISPDIASSPQAVGTLMIEIDRIHVDINISSHIQILKERVKIIISSAKHVPYQINKKLLFGTLRFEHGAG